MFFEALYFRHFPSIYTMQLEPPKRETDGPRRVTETLKTRLDMFRFEENVHSVLQEQTNATPTPSTKSFCLCR